MATKGYFCLVPALLAIAMVGQFGDSRASAIQRDGPGEPGLQVRSVTEAEVRGPVPAVVDPPEGRLYRLDDDGLPLVSKAGFVQLKHEGEGFYYANLLSHRRGYAERRGDFDTDNWGDVDSFRMLERVVRRWRKTRSEGPRLGIEDISSPFGGFGDYDGDGAADHRTHQLGSHLNVLIPCKGLPEVEVFFDVRDEDRYDAFGTQELAVMLFEEGAWSITTTSATRLLERPSVFPLPFEATRVTGTGTRLYRIGERQSLILMKEAKNHGNHFNARLTPTW